MDSIKNRVVNPGDEIVKSVVPNPLDVEHVQEDIGDPGKIDVVRTRAVEVSAGTVEFKCAHDIIQVLERVIQ